MRVLVLDHFPLTQSGLHRSKATHLTTASGTLYGFAGAIFGIVTAFLGSEKG